MRSYNAGSRSVGGFGLHVGNVDYLAFRYGPADNRSVVCIESLCPYESVMFWRNCKGRERPINVTVADHYVAKVGLAQPSRSANKRI